jgi:DNA topoisomerase-1
MEQKNIPAKIQETIENSSLTYVSDCDFEIVRKKDGENFNYFHNDQLITDSKTIERLSKLVIPPAWNDVHICQKDNGHIQAIGYDAKGRKQYVYHKEWNLLQQQHKFNSMIQFSEILPALRKEVRNDMSLPGLQRKRVLSTIVWLLEHTFIRNKHVNIKGDEVLFQFTGKSGIHHEIDIHNKRVATIIKAMKELPGQELFQYLDSSGIRQSIHSHDVNEYLKQITGEDITAKHFRTWGGTVITADTLYKTGEFTSATQAKKNITATIKEVAKHLGNTPTTCRNYYVHPTVIETYENKLLIPHFDEVYKTGKENNGLSIDEYATVTLLKKYPLTLIN